MSNDDTTSTSDNLITEEMKAELDYIVGEMYGYREEQQLPKPTDEEIQSLIEFYVSVKENAALYAMIGEGSAIINMDTKNDQIDVIVREHSCPECDGSKDEEVEHNRSIN